MIGSKNKQPLHRRKSASMDAAFSAELNRVREMTIEERVKAALTMRERFQWLPSISGKK